MNRLQLIQLLIRFRMTRAGMAQGLSEEAAAAMAEEVIRNQASNSLKAIATPDGAIAAMVETYMAKVGPVVGGIFNADNPPTDPKFIAANAQAIREIEEHRSRFIPGEGTLSDRITDYAYYRTRLEVTRQFGISPSDMGLDHATVKEMVKICIAANGPKYDANSPENAGCFVATVCFGSEDHPTVHKLREFRDGTLSHSVFGRYFIRSYYRLGPRAANWITSKPRLRRLGRFCLRQLVKILK